MNIKQIIQKAAVAGVTLALLEVAAIPISADVLSEGEFSNVKIYNTGESCLGTARLQADATKCEVTITKWTHAKGLVGQGNVEMTIENSRGIIFDAHIFDGKGTWTSIKTIDDMYPINIWAINTRYTFLPGSGDRVISGYWEFSN